MTRIAILGTGLIGTSLGLALRERGKAGIEVIGHDRYHDVAKAALKRGAFHRITDMAKQAVEGADVVIFAAPLLAIQQLMADVAPAVPPTAVLTDTGSTKAEVLKWAQELLPNPAHFVGSHPMAGKTEFGPDAAEATLFDGARWIVVPGVTSTEAAIEVVENLAFTVGATKMVMDADEHDAYAAAISHVPMLSAVALFSLMRSSAAWPELSMMAAGGFRDTTRLAATDPTMAFDITVTNRTHILHWMDRLVDTLRDLRERVAATDAEAEQDLFKILSATEFDYSQFRAGKVGRVEVDPALDQVTPFSFQEFVAGGWVRQRMDAVFRYQQQRADEAEQAARERPKR